MNCPIFINCRDRITCLSVLVDWLEKAGHENIYLLDNDSSYPPLLEYYEQTPHTVVRLNENLAHTALWKTDVLDRYAKRADYYVYTDPDVVPVEECPPDALELFVHLLERYPTFVKAGFGLRIDDLPDCYEFKEEVVLWERQFWQHRLEPGVFVAPIDTTFALYRGNATHAIDRAIRTGYPYLARHTPWYLDSGNLSEEERYYRRHAREGVTHWNAEALPDWLSQKISELRSSEWRFDGGGDDAGLLLQPWSQEPAGRDEQTYTPWADPGWLSWNAMSPEVEFCKFAAQLVRMVKPRVVIETGVGQGYITRRIAKQMQTGQMLICYESDPVVRRGLTKLSFFREACARVADVGSPSAGDFARADLTILDSDFSERSEELKCWWANAPFGAVILIHDCGNGHASNTGHAALAAMIEQISVPGVFLKNPRGSFLGVKSRHGATTSTVTSIASLNQEVAEREWKISRLNHAAAEAEQSLRSRDAVIEEMKRNAAKREQVRSGAQQALRNAKIELKRLSAIETSTIWRMTSPLRSFAGYVPKSVRLYGRRAARVVWWLLTPHRMPARLRFLKDRQRLAHGATATHAKREDRKVLISSNSRKATNAPQQPSPIEGLQRDLIASSSLFDADWYLKEYPDVAAAKMDPALHYLLHGAREGRDPSALFSTRAYLELYPSVAQTRTNPLVHYVKDGQKRGLTVIESERGSVQTAVEEVPRRPAESSSYKERAVHTSANFADPRNLAGTYVDRREKILSGLDLRMTTGVEIGPLASPIVSRDDGRIFYVDHQNTEGLRHKYANDPIVDVTKIVDVDAIWGSNTLQEAIGPGVGVDYVVASHVVEHVPDLISWLEELRAVLRPSGTVRLVVPDRRYTFDYLRRESSVVEVLSAYAVRTRIPLPYCIIDEMVNCARVDVEAAWLGKISSSSLVRHHTVPNAIRLARRVHEEGAYHDVHCWVFTPRSFADLFANLAEMGLVHFSCAYFVDTAHNQIEFFVALTPSDDTGQMVESWKRMAGSVR